MFSKCKQLSRFLTASLAESIADLLYEMGRDLLGKNDYEGATRWLERAFDVLQEQSLEVLSAEAGELKMSIMQNIGTLETFSLAQTSHENSVQAYMKSKTPDTRSKAWHMLQLLEEVSTRRWL